MDYTKFIDDIAKQTFIHTEDWDARYLKKFRNYYYDDYFLERDSLTVRVMKKEPNAYKDMFYFRPKSAGISPQLFVIHFSIFSNLLFLRNSSAFLILGSIY